MTLTVDYRLSKIRVQKVEKTRGAVNGLLLRYFFSRLRCISATFCDQSSRPLQVIGPTFPLKISLSSGPEEKTIFDLFPPPPLLKIFCPDLGFWLVGLCALSRECSFAQLCRVRLFCRNEDSGKSSQLILHKYF